MSDQREIKVADLIWRGGEISLCQHDDAGNVIHYPLYIAPDGTVKFKLPQTRDDIR